MRMEVVKNVPLQRTKLVVGQEEDRRMVVRRKAPLH
jgi:hypothetical protein